MGILQKIKDIVNKKNKPSPEKGKEPTTIEPKKETAVVEPEEEVVLPEEIEDIKKDASKLLKEVQEFYGLLATQEGTFYDSDPVFKEIYSEGLNLESDIMSFIRDLSPETDAEKAEEICDGFWDRAEEVTTSVESRLEMVDPRLQARKLSQDLSNSDWNYLYNGGAKTTVDQVSSALIELKAKVDAFANAGPIKEEDREKAFRELAILKKEAEYQIKYTDIQTEFNPKIEEIVRQYEENSKKTKQLIEECKALTNSANKIIEKYQNKNSEKPKNPQPGEED